MFDQRRPILHRGPGRRLSGPRLQAGHLIDAQDNLVVRQLPGIQVADPLDLLGEGRVAGYLGRQPHLLPPRLESVVQQDLADRLGRDRFHDAIAHQLLGNLAAIPLRQRSTDVIRSFTGDLHHVHRHFGGKKPACGRVRDDLVTLPSDPSETAAPISGHAFPSGRPIGRLRQGAIRRRRRGSPDTAEPNPAKCS